MVLVIIDLQSLCIQFKIFNRDFFRVQEKRIELVSLPVVSVTNAECEIVQVCQGDVF